MCRNKRSHIAAKTRNFFDDARTDEGVCIFGHHENRFDFFVQIPVHQGKLKFKLKIRHGAQPAHNRLRLLFRGVFHKEAVKAVSLGVWQVGNRLFYEFKPLARRKQRGFAFVFGNGHDDATK